MNYNNNYSEILNYNIQNYKSQCKHYMIIMNNNNDI